MSEVELEEKKAENVAFPGGETTLSLRRRRRKVDLHKLLRNDLGSGIETSITGRGGEVSRRPSYRAVFYRTNRRPATVPRGNKGGVKVS